MVHLIRSLTDADADLVLTKVDGVGAFDHVLRASMLDGLLRLPTAHRLLPYVRMCYEDPSHYVWLDGAAVPHDICQGEGGEQGDPLMPALFCLAMHGPLCDSAARLRDGEFIIAYLDDIYLLTSRDRARPAHDLVTETVWQGAGVRPHAGKTECWSAGGGPAPPGIAELGAADGAPVWKGDLPLDQRGVEVLGSPVGSLEYARACLTKRAVEEAGFLEDLPGLGDAQMEWLLLSCCGAPRANYIFRTTPSRHARTHARSRAPNGALAGCIGKAVSPLRFIIYVHSRICHSRIRNRVKSFLIRHGPRQPA